jgi:hypothetical protein
MVVDVVASLILRVAAMCAQWCVRPASLFRSTNGGPGGRVGDTADEISGSARFFLWDTRWTRCRDSRHHRHRRGALRGAGRRTRPASRALVLELGVSNVNIRALLWTNSRRHESITVLDAAIKAVRSQLDRDGIEMPANIVGLQATPSFRAVLYNDESITPSSRAVGRFR